MRKDKSRNQDQNRFVVGNHGSCEARLFEFRERHSTDPHIVRIAATGFDEAVAGLRWYEPAFEVESVQNLGVIFMVSGSPVD